MPACHRENADPEHAHSDVAAARVRPHLSQAEKLAVQEDKPAEGAALTYRHMMRI
jgi:hypothetical protein